MAQVPKPLEIEKRPGSGSLIVKSNALVNAEYRLTVTQMRIVYLMAMQVMAEDEAFKTYYLRTRDFQEELGISGNSLHERMVDIIKDMIQSVIQIRDEHNNVEQFPLIIHSKHQSKNGLIAIQFHPDLKGHMLQLKENFTSFYDHYVLSLKSFNSMRIYELLKQYEKIGSRRMKVVELRRLLRLEDKYRSYNMFKKKVIIKAQDDLDKYCDISFDFEEIKKSRKVDELLFDIRTRRQTRSYLTKAETQPETGIRKKLADMGLTRGQIRKYTEEDPKDEAWLGELIRDTQQRFESGKVKNPAAYLVKLIETGAKMRSQYQREHEAQKKEQKAQKKHKVERAEQNEDLVRSLRDDFAAFVSEQREERYTQATEQDWQNFAESYREVPFIANKIFDQGKLLRDQEETIDWFKYFLCPDDDHAFFEWALRYKNTQLEKRKDKIHVLSEQGSLF